MTEHKIALAILGMVAVIAAVGLVMQFGGASGNVAFRAAHPGIAESAERLCSDIQCQNGMGAIPVGEKGDYWICVCGQQFADKSIASWSNQWKGDEMHNPGEFYTDGARLVRKFREY